MWFRNFVSHVTWQVSGQNFQFEPTIMCSLAAEYMWESHTSLSDGFPWRYPAPPTQLAWLKIREIVLIGHKTQIKKCIITKIYPG